jgi:hypothetical protein
MANRPGPCSKAPRRKASSNATEATTKRQKGSSTSLEPGCLCTNAQANAEIDKAWARSRRRSENNPNKKLDWKTRCMLVRLIKQNGPGSVSMDFDSETGGSDGEEDDDDCDS